MKYYGLAIVFAEIPTEISLALNITNCPNHCLNCHSPWLREDIGEPVTKEAILDLLDKNKEVTCLLLMGGDKNHQEIVDLCKELNGKIKVAMYSGNDEIDPDLVEVLDYYKVGSYKEELGPLNKPTTNQRLYRINNKELEDITYMFWKQSF